MEENVALDTTKQKKFAKSIKGIKKLIKKDVEKSEEDASPKPKVEKLKKKRPDRGLVYLSHIPHGFYEHEMTQYFKQFGMVTNVRVIRSERTGNSKGFAFVEFKEPAVGEIVAETMNNYLMGKRLIKAAYIPPEKQKTRAMRKNWNRFNNPGKNSRLKLKKAYNENKDEKGDLKRARKILSNINKTKKKLSELGINYDFFTPVDIPEALQDTLQEQKDVSNEVKTKVEIHKKDKKSQSTDIKEDMKTVKKSKVKLELQVKPEKAKSVKVEMSKVAVVKIEEKKPNKSKKDKKNVVQPEPVINMKEQNRKQLKLKDAGVKPPENFIKVQEESQDSDSSLDFDSDEYEKMLEDSGDESVIDADSDEAGSDEDEESEEEDVEDIPPPKKNKGISMSVVAPQKQQKKQKKQAPEQNKRKAPQKPLVDAKKSKFEKQTQKPMKKQFKKKVTK